MGTVIMHNVVSVDGFIADDKDDVGPLHDWYFSGDTPILERGDQQFDHSGAGSRFKVSSASVEYVRSMWELIGTIVMGRNLFDLVNGWEGDPPAGDHVVVVSHRPKPDADAAFENAACIGCGACVAACPNGSAMLFTAAKVTHLNLLPQGQPERESRVLDMVTAMDAEGFGGCTNVGECVASCPKEIPFFSIATMNREYLRALRKH